MRLELHHGDCRQIMASIPSSSIDTIITDPPYAEISRDYGRLSEDQWHDLMSAVVAECRRVLTPRGSAVFILQPNSSKIGRMRPWLWQFMAHCAQHWNIVQDAYWFNHATMPGGGAPQHGLLRPALKYMVWMGEPDCYRDQSTVLMSPSDATLSQQRHEKLEKRSRLYYPSGHSIDRHSIIDASIRRDGVTPFNVSVCANTNSSSSAGAHGHGAGTPLPLVQWWTRYLVPPDGVVLDPFCGSGTVGVAAGMHHASAFIGVDQNAHYLSIARNRIVSSMPPMERLA